MSGSLLVQIYKLQIHKPNTNSPDGKEDFTIYRKN